MFEQKINTVSIRVNEESFAVVPFDNYKDAVQAAKQALVALNTGEDTEALRKRLNEVEAALVKEITKSTMVLNFDGERLVEIAKEQYLEHHLKELNERVVDPNSNEVRGRVVPAGCDFVGMLFDTIQANAAPQTEKTEKEPVAWMLKKAKGAPGAVTNDKGLLAVWMNEECEIVPLYE